MEIIATLGLDRASLLRSIAIQGISYGAIDARPVATNGAVCLIGDSSPTFSGCSMPAIRGGLREMLSGPNEFPRTRLDFDGVPSEPILCSGCNGTGEHLTCCAPDFSCCNLEKCEACGGRGEWIPSRVWSIELAPGGPIVDAFYLRVILDHLGTTRPAIGVTGDTDPIVFSHLGRTALLMPMLGHLRRVDMASHPVELQP